MSIRLQHRTGEDRITPEQLDRMDREEEKMVERRRELLRIEREMELEAEPE